MHLAILVATIEESMTATDYSPRSTAELVNGKTTPSWNWWSGGSERPPQYRAAIETLPVTVDRTGIEITVNSSERDGGPRCISRPPLVGLVVEFGRPHHLINPDRGGQFTRPSALDVHLQPTVRIAQQCLAADQPVGRAARPRCLWLRVHTPGWLRHVR